MVLLYKMQTELLKNLLNNSYENEVSKIIVVTGKGLHSNVEKDPYVSKDLSILNIQFQNLLKIIFS